MYVVNTDYRLKHVTQVCIKFNNAVGNREVSIACDDSCGAFQEMKRCDIRMYTDGNDVTHAVFGVEKSGTVHASNENVMKALQWLEAT